MTLALTVLVAGCAGPQTAEDAAGASGAAPGVTSLQLPRTQLTSADRSEWRALLRWPDECEDAFRLTHAPEAAGLVFHVLAPAVSLVQVACAAGAYQGSTVFVRLDETGASPVARVLSFRTYASPDESALESSESLELWGETEFLPDARELTLLAVSRQLRDCGTWSRYSLAEEEPRLLELYGRIECPAEPGPPAEPEPGRPPVGWTKIPIN